MFRFLTSGESHGPGLTAIIEGIPAGLKQSAEDINYHLRRRQGGYGRGGRMKIEKDQVKFRSGVRHDDIRNVIERSSARETAARVAVGAVCLALLNEFSVAIYSHVLSVGPVGKRDAQRSAIANNFASSYWDGSRLSNLLCVVGTAS